jgi:hypothetical protein
MAIAQAAGTKTEKPAAAAKAEARYTVAAFAPPTAWPEPKFVPTAPAADVPAATVPAAAVLPAAELAAAAPVSETNRLPPIAKPAALVDINDTIKPIQVKTIKAKLTQIQTTDLGPVVVRVREEPTEPAPVEAPPTASAPAPKTAAVTAALIARSAAEPIPTAALRFKAPASAAKPTAMPSAAVAPAVVAIAPVVPHAPEAVAPEARRIVAAQSAPTHAG